MKKRSKKKSRTKFERDIEKTYPRDQFIEKLRRLADSLETGKRFAIQIARERIFVPAHAIVNIEHEREGKEEEVEFQIKWSNASNAGPSKSRKTAKSKRSKRVA